MTQTTPELPAADDRAERRHPFEDAASRHAWAGGAAPSQPDPTGDVSLFGLLSALLRHRGLVLGAALACAAATAIVTLVLPRSYTVASALLPQSQKLPGNLSSLASQFGFMLPMSQGTESPALYSSLLLSHQLLGAAVDTKYSVRADSGTVTAGLAPLVHAKGRTEALRRDAAIRYLSHHVTADVDGKSGMVRVTVTLRAADLALAVNRRLLELVNEFNLTTRQTQAGAERRFDEQRLNDVRRDLRDAEDRLRAFLQQNREYRSSPELSLQQERLAREVSRLQQLLTTVSDAYERARMDEVRDTPVVTVVEAPEAPVRPDPRGLLKKALFALIVGLLLGSAVAITREAGRRLRAAGPSDYRRYSELRAETLRDLRRPWRLLRSHHPESE